MTIREMMAMYHSLQFVEELLDYIEQYPDDDYMTMECLCRKLHKHELIAKVDGHWQPLDKRCEDCIFVEGSHWCDGCDKTPKGMKEYDEYFAKADRKTEPQRGCDADCNEDCTECAKETELWKAEQTEPQTEVNALYDQIVEDIDTRVKCANAKKVEDEPQTDCHRCIHFTTDNCRECFNKELFIDSGYITKLNEPDTDCTWK